MAIKLTPVLFAVFTVLASTRPTTLSAQVMIEVGTGTLLNSSFQPPSPYANIQPGGRIQLLFPASELQAAGMGAGTITSLGFHVLGATSTTLQDYSIHMGPTSSTALGTTWETGLTDVWGPQDFTDLPGWTLHTLTTPFVWDGFSNLVVETCYHNGSSSQNAVVYQTATSYVSSVSRLSPNNSICTEPGGALLTWPQRPNIRFFWVALNAPPVALPVANPAFSCDGTIGFTDNSGSFTDSWAWDFGDGTTATGQSVIHTYITNGTFTVNLIVTNGFGVDSAQVLVTVGLADTPIPACDAPSTGTVPGFGILDMTIQGVPHPSGDALAEGYLDHTCQSTTLAQGTPLNVVITAGDPAQQAVRAWVDWDNSGSFTGIELLASGMGPVVTASMLVPSGAALDTPLRMRAIAAYALVTPAPGPCGTVQFGQAEDYTIIVTLNPAPPLPLFSAAPLYSCNGSVQFTDLTLNAPTAWTWDFGDGATSSAQSPLHQYAASGIYSVSLMASNANGQADTLYSNLITVNLGGLLAPAGCIPNTQAYCCGYGILGFHFAGINSMSADGSEGYQDRSCGNTAMVEEGQLYAWSVTTGDEALHDVRIWIDMDNDGNFSPDELVATVLNAISPGGIITIPIGPLFDTPVRLRVQADVIGQSTGPCAAPLYGQCEDFAVVISQNTAPPVAGFSATPIPVCESPTQFTDQSTNIPTSWAWDFGDGTTSTEQDPAHTYSAFGQFTVSMTASNAFGSDTETRQDYILSVPEWACDTMVVPPFTDVLDTRCTGVLSDDGGPNGNYQQWPSGAYKISPPNATSVTLYFSQFQWGPNPNRRLAIYDGPSVVSPLIVALSGNSLPSGPISSTGPSITLRQVVSGGGSSITGAGFLLQWDCSTLGMDDLTGDPFVNIHPVPADQWFDVELRPDASGVRTLSVVNVNGQVMLDQDIAPHSTLIRMDCANWPSGPYAVRLCSPGKQWVRTIILR